MKMEDIRKYLAELVGTLILVFIGCGAASISGKYIGIVGIAFAFGLSFLAMFFIIGKISGCHINPAVSIAMLVARKMHWKDTIYYVIAQCIGAIIGAWILSAVIVGMHGYSVTMDGLGQNGYGAQSPAEFTLLACMAAEIVLTAIFVFVFFGSTGKKASMELAGIPIGFALFFIHLVGIPITGTSVNPARSLGPALFVGGETLPQLWLFWVAPIVGGIIAALIWKYAFEKD